MVAQRQTSCWMRQWWKLGLRLTLISEAYGWCVLWNNSFRYCWHYMLDIRTWQMAHYRRGSYSPKYKKARIRRTLQTVTSSRANRRPIERSSVGWYGKDWIDSGDSTGRTPAAWWERGMDVVTTRSTPCSNNHPTGLLYLVCYRIAQSYRKSR